VLVFPIAASFASPSALVHLFVTYRDTSVGATQRLDWGMFNTQSLHDNIPSRSLTTLVTLASIFVIE